MKISKVFIYPCIMAILALTMPLPAPAQDLSGRIDATINALRSTQNQDGSYGERAAQPESTAFVLLAFTSSPRRYTDADGPFVRKAAAWIAARQEASGAFPPSRTRGSLFTTAFCVLALEGVNRRRFAKVIELGRNHLTEQIQRDPQSLCADKETTFAVMLALAEVHPESLRAMRDLFDGSGDHDPYSLACRLLAGGERYNGDSLEAWLAALERGTPAAPSQQEMPGRSSATAAEHVFGLFAAARLCSRLERKDLAPERWADRLAAAAAGQFPGAENAGTSPNLDKGSTALLVVALSDCLASTANAARAAVSAAPASSQPPLPAKVAAPLALNEAIEQALAFLEKNQKDGKFGFMGFDDPGITAMALTAAIRASRLAGRAAPPAYVAAGLDYLDSLRKSDGSIYLTGLKTYVTSVSLMAFTDSGDPRYEQAIKAAQDFLILIQADEGEGYSMEEDAFYGGMGYGSDERPDLSNTQMALDALKSSGLDEKHQAFQKAISFLKKCQNVAEADPTEVVLSDGKKVVPGTDGGGIYYPGSSKADLEEIDEGVYVARSYGSMTYALLKSFLFTGLDPEDKRVKAAVKWIEDNFTLDENPGFEVANNPDAGQQGLYYYYLTMARALDALGREEITDSEGRVHLWRKELEVRILGNQRVDGSWINERSARWFEGNPVLATSYALMVLDACQP